MTARKLFTTLALLGSVALVQLPAQAAEPSVVAPESPTRELKVHDKAPDLYKRDDMALRGWKEKGLSQPDEDSQWVKMQDNYVLIEITNGTIKKIVPAKG